LRAVGALPRESTSAEDAVLDVQGLTTQFHGRGGTVTAVREVSFRLGRTKKLGIVGESGCGKTALALSILGLIEPPGRVSGGDVILNGRRISALGDRQLARVRGREISLIFQDPMSSLDPVRRIGSQIGEALRRHQPRLGRRELSRHVLELMREVEIPLAESRIDDYPHQYSGGMRQRVMIAIALANRPDVVIADEPTTALDVTTQAQVLTLLDRLVRDHGTAVILITHNLGLVAEFCDDVHVMYAGRFVERASTSALFRAPLHPYTEALLQAIPQPQRDRGQLLRSIPGAPPNLAEIPRGCAFEPRCPYASGRALCRTAVPRELAPPGHPRHLAACHFVGDRAREAGLTSRQGPT
jgi:oligopeptide/dipeptide ABC transporter ATP-binding protein